MAASLGTSPTDHSSPTLPRTLLTVSRGSVQCLSGCFPPLSSMLSFRAGKPHFLQRAPLMDMSAFHCSHLMN